MEPLGQTDGSGGSLLNQEEEVASIRSAMKELQESIEHICKASLAKMIKLGKLYSGLLYLSLLYSALMVKNVLLFVVTHDTVASTPNGLAAGTEISENSGLDKAKTAGLEFHPDQPLQH